MTFVVRDARHEDIRRLQAIERAAAELFRGTGLIDIDRMSVLTDDEHRAAIEDQLSLVALAEGAVVGFVMGEAYPPDCYLHELDVAPSHGRRGAGALLVDAFCRRAAARAATRVVLSTFTGPAWNAPLYRRLGFVDLDASELSPWMQAIAAAHAAFLDPSTRTFMARRL